MTEGLFILTTIFVAYVVYQVVNDQKKSTKPGHQEPVKAAEKAEPVKKAEPPKPQAAAKKEEPAVQKPAPAESSQTAPAPAPAASKPGLRDPKTGEVATAYTNYRFTKRWIKDALVAEGLLPKVYKNNELDAETEAAIKGALAQLEAMEKYRA